MMTKREFILNLVAVWLGFILATIWWVFAYGSFVVPAYMRYNREGNEWPRFAMRTLDVSIGWNSDYHVWFWCAAFVTGALVFSRRPAPTQRKRAFAARALSYGYLAVLAAISLCVARISAL